LAYLASLPPDQARARKMRHEADEGEIAIGRMVGASRREGRRQRKNLPAVRRMASVKSSPTSQSRPRAKR
jgi:chorismate-pyruvate lyase